MDTQTSRFWERGRPYTDPGPPYTWRRAVSIWYGIVYTGPALYNAML